MPPAGFACMSLIILLISLKAHMAVITYPARRRLHRPFTLMIVMPTMKTALSAIQIKCSAVNISFPPALFSLFLLYHASPPITSPCR